MKKIKNSQNIIVNEMINKKGEMGASAQMFDIDDNRLLENIEPRIKPLVLFFLENDYVTVNSCQGHYSKEEERGVRANIVFETKNNTEHHRFKRIIAKFNKKYNKTFNTLNGDVLDIEIYDEFLKPTNYHYIRVYFNITAKKRKELDKVFELFQDYLKNNYFEKL